MLTITHDINKKLDNPNFLSENLVFIDSQIEDYQFLVSGIYGGINVVIIPENQDGIEVITTYLEKYINYRQNLDAIHIFSHGSPGSVKLGNIFLTILSLQDLDVAVVKKKFNYKNCCNDEIGMLGD